MEKIENQEFVSQARDNSAEEILQLLEGNQWGCVRCGNDPCSCRHKPL